MASWCVLIDRIGQYLLLAVPLLASGETAERESAWLTEAWGSLPVTVWKLKTDTSHRAQRGTLWEKAPSSLQLFMILSSLHAPPLVLPLLNLPQDHWSVRASDSVTLT